MYLYSEEVVHFFESLIQPLVNEFQLSIKKEEKHFQQ